MFDLKNKVAIVTGGASGIGAATVRLFHRLGARITIGDIQDEAGHALARELGDAVRYSRLNVSDPADWKKTVNETEAAFGKVTLLVNNAGHPGYWKTVVDLTLDEFRHVCSINQDGVFLGINAVTPSMIAAGGGSIMNTSSAWGLVGAANNIDYCASKWAVTGMSKAAALELACHKIRVNSVHPGLVLTPMVEKNLKKFDLKVEDFVSSMPLKRGAQPLEIAAVFAFLASDAASYVTGHALSADGGQTAQ